MKSIRDRIIDPQRRRRLALQLVLYFTFLSSPSPMWPMATPAANALSVAPEKIEVPAVDVSSIADIDKLRVLLAERAAKVIGIKGSANSRYSGLSRTQANSVLTIAEEFGPKHFDDAVRVAWCESRLQPQSMNGKNHDGTADRGLFQLNDGGTMQRLGVDTREVFDASTNARAAKVLFDDRGWQPWVCANKHKTTVTRHTSKIHQATAPKHNTVKN